MTATEEVPMPEPVGSTTYFNLQHGEVVSLAYTPDQLRAYADARCAKLQEEVDSRQKQIHRRANAMNAVYNELQRVAPWSESNDMGWVDEMLCGISLLAQERDALAEKVKAMEEDARRLDWIDQMVTKHSAVWLLTSGENRFVQIRSPAFDFGVKNHPTVSGGVRAAIDAATVGP